LVLPCNASIEIVAKGDTKAFSTLNAQPSIPISLKFPLMAVGGADANAQ
jgi:hypothetical protein